MPELELTGDHVARLGDEDLRLLVVKLCEAELRRGGQGTSSVLAGGNQTAPDGGLDVLVQRQDGPHVVSTTIPTLASGGVPAEAASGVFDKPEAGSLPDFIPRLETGFQVKCEDMPAGQIATEMRPKGVLRDSIKELIAHKGAYVIVSSKGSVAVGPLKNRIAAMRAAVADVAGFEDLHLDFYDRDRLARWVREYAGVEMWLRERINARLTGWQGYGTWAGPKSGGTYLVDDTTRMIERAGGASSSALSVHAGVDRMRSALRSSGGIVRLVGLSGTGKTRLAQALFETGVGKAEPLDQALVLYTDLGNVQEPSAREMLVWLGTAGQPAIVVVDNCNPTAHRALVNVVEQYEGHLSLLTVEYDVADDDTPDATEVYELAPASDVVLEQLLKQRSPGLSNADRGRIIEFSGGNARIALALAGTVGKGESVAVLNDAELFGRLFRQGQSDEPELQAAAEVCALVYSFDGKDTTSDTSELKLLADLGGLTVNGLYKHVASLLQRDLAQSRGKWRAVLPPALANRLAKQALRTIPAADITQTFARCERLLLSFSRRLNYLHDSPEAREIAEGWMEDKNWLSNPGKLTDARRKLFFNLAPLVPGKVLSAMERTLDDAHAADFAQRNRYSLHAWSTLLRHLAYEPQAFDRAATLLLTLAEHEDRESIDCLGAWKETFQMALSGTMASPSQRAQLLKRLMATASGRRRTLVWAAVDAMLAVSQISSTHEFSFGARPYGYGWAPTARADQVEWFESAFLLVRQMMAQGADGRTAARNAVAAHFRSVWGYRLTDQVTALVQELAGADEWLEGWAAVRAAIRFDGEDMDPEMLGALRKLAEALRPQSLGGLVRAFTLIHGAGTLDVADFIDESEEEENQNEVPPSDRVDAQVVAFGASLADQEALLRELLPELLHQERGRVFLLGLGIGRACKEKLRIWGLLRDGFLMASDAPRVDLLAGFLKGVREQESVTAGQMLDGAVTDAKLDAHFPGLLGVPQDDQDGERLIASMKRGTAKPAWYRFGLGGAGVGGLSVAKFCDAVEQLAAMEEGYFAAIDTLSWQIRLHKRPGSSALRELVPLARRLLEQLDFTARERNSASRVNPVVELALTGPEAFEAATRFASRFAASFGEQGSYGDEYHKVACTLFSLQPLAALEAFFSANRPVFNLPFRARFIARHGSMVDCAPHDVVLDWVAANPEARAPLVAREVSFVASEGRSAFANAGERDEKSAALNPLVRGLLKLAPDKVAVLEGFGKELTPSYYIGSLKQVLAPQIAVLRELSQDADTTISSWSLEVLARLERRIENDGPEDLSPQETFE
ncbi:hypothetical protein [Pseudorhodoferax soli]|uniref:Uncharacterized protein n=1 Tax=Pseudorhodoferax soli TaxID=545864 RepID=A0A368XPW5_9BURK|nr:hypothetical protein [Pseudorhodoferax soli]RCW69206.1 hypothetical protein DES41_10677 [Pseudorhodoferax soli]